MAQSLLTTYFRTNEDYSENECSNDNGGDMIKNTVDCNLDCNDNKKENNGHALIMEKECLEVIKTFLKSGGYARERLEKVIGNIWKHYNITCTERQTKIMQCAKSCIHYQEEDYSGVDEEEEGVVNQDDEASSTMPT